jgi:hypothetical protein
MDRLRFARKAAPPRLGVALLASLIVGAAGCGGDERDKQRERVADYIRSEQAVMRRSQPDFERANDAYVAYAKGEAARDVVAQVRRSERTIRNARDGVSVLDPPADARRLHDKLLRYLDINVDLARETTRLAAYVPAADRALSPLDRVNHRLASRLAGADGSAAQARALERFGASLDAIVDSLRDLKAPLVLEPAQANQIRRLESTRALAGKLRRALEQQDAERVARLLKRFRRIGSARGVRRLLADRALARYSRLLQQLDAAYASVQREQLRLDRSLR